MKAERLGVSREVLGNFEEEGLGFLWQLVIWDEIWDHPTILSTKDSLWSTPIKHNQHQRNTKQKPLLEKSG
jgi:hypothetical protein